MAAAAFPDLSRAIAGVVAPDSALAKQAAEMAYANSSPMLFNHVMRSYYLGQLVASVESPQRHDDELVFLSTTLHDLGLTEIGQGPRRFEIEGADMARRFLAEHGVPDSRSWLVWDTITLHPWGDINLFKEPEARIAQLGIMAGAAGVGLATVEPDLIAQVVEAFPRLDFKTGFVDLLMNEARLKPGAHTGAYDRPSLLLHGANSRREGDHRKRAVCGIGISW